MQLRWKNKKEEKRTGSIKWCKICSRYHGREGCNLIPGVRIAKSGNKVIHMVHPPKEK